MGAELPRPRASASGTEIVVFGRRVVEEALALDTVEPLELRVSERTPGQLRHALRGAARARSLEVDVVREGDVAALSGAPRHDGGVALRIRLRGVMDVEAFAASRTGRAARTPMRVLAFDGLTNSQNIGMIVRTALATGIDGLLWPTVGVPWVNGLVVKASAGTALRAPIVRCHALSEGLATLQGAGFTCAGLDAMADVSLDGWSPPHRVVFVVGNETTGLSEDVRPLLDATVSIPMAGEVESLNVAVAASLVCYRLFKPSGLA
jgi:23S rRNA (guanosine2251-2'-O)-methyltransferase